MTTTGSDKARLWNARRGVARAAEQITQNFNEAFAADVSLSDMCDLLMENLQDAIAEMRAAETVIPETPAA